MSTIQFLREKAGVLVAGVIGLSLLLFVVSDFFGNGRAQRLQARKYYELGEIDGQTVSYQDYELRLQNLLEIYKLSGRTNIDEATSESLREQTWQQMVREKILDSQYDKLGIGVSTEEVDELVLGNSPHPIVQQLFADQQTGMLNKSFLVNFLKQIEVDETARTYWLFFENEIVNDRMNTKYNTLVAKGLYVTSKQAEFDQALSASTVDFSFIQKNYSLIPDSSVTVSKSEIETYYNDHKQSYKRTALRDIEYVTFDVVPSEDDIKQAETWIRNNVSEFAAAENPAEFINRTADTRHIGFYMPLSMVPENLRDFVQKEDTREVFGPYVEDGIYKAARLIAVASRPDSVRARHILIASGQTRTLEDARKLADSLKTLLRNGAKFEALALTNSDDPGSQQLGGDLGWFPEGRMVVPFNNACFEARKGEIVSVETTFGIHIIEVLDRSKESRKYDIGYLDRKILPSTLTNQSFFSDASQFAANNDSYEKFIKAIAEKGLNKRTASDIAPNQKTLPGLESPRGLIISLYQAEEGKIILDPTEQAVFEVGDKYVVGYCTRVQEEGIADVEDVENDIRFELIRKKKAGIIAAEFSKNTGDGKSLDDIAAAMGLTVQEATQVNFRSFTVAGVGTEPALIAAASVAKQGAVTGPVEGINGVYMLSANSISPSQGEDLSMLKERLGATFQMRGSYEAYEALRKDANIVDKRYKFY
ncbi:MAG: peptidylprolyl isomerase [Bacteroidales bacterium]|jgi:peptidyl-prolyl cis-trans isomerase D|nr:peptidylprolyl isomerase [Bacteroidales bacterium]